MTSNMSDPKNQIGVLRTISHPAVPKGMIFCFTDEAVHLDDKDMEIACNSIPVDKASKVVRWSIEVTGLRLQYDETRIGVLKGGSE